MSVSIKTRMIIPLAASCTISRHSVAAFKPSAGKVCQQRNAQSTLQHQNAQLMPQPFAKLDCDDSPSSL